MTPILYSFRRCPYAMRARIALRTAGIEVELREIILRDKPAHMLEISPKGTVPVLLLPDQTVIDESFDIMIWALTQSDPLALLDMPAQGHDIIRQIDGPFKQALDRYKYPTRYEDVDPTEERTKAAVILHGLNAQLSPYLFGTAPKLADYGVLTFVRQFAHVDKAWFDAQNWPNVRRWLDLFLTDPVFLGIMEKYPQWKPDADSPIFL